MDDDEVDDQTSIPLYPSLSFNPSKPHQPPLGDRKLGMLINHFMIVSTFLFTSYSTIFLFEKPTLHFLCFKNMGANAPKESILKMRPSLHFSEQNFEACGKAQPLER